MSPTPIGTGIRVISNHNKHAYRIGRGYTITTLDGDGTLMARDEFGKEVHWLRWQDCAAGGLRWEWLREPFPFDGLDLLAAFPKTHRLHLKPKIRDRIILRGPKLKNVILAALQQMEEARPSAHKPALQTRTQNIPR